jgi:uncharacterized cupredoxin-like copper-binding protein
MPDARRRRSLPMHRIVIHVVVLVLGAAVAGSAFASGSATGVTVKLKEFKVLASGTTVKAGKVTFTVTNVGKINHEMVVMKSNLPPGKLPVNANHRVPEKGVVGEAGDIHPGQTKKVTLTLPAGRYVLLCNIAGHYVAGQYSGFVTK